MSKCKKIARRGRPYRAAGIGGFLAILLGAAVWASAPRADAPPLAGAFADAFVLVSPPRPAPETAFRDAAGREVGLASFRGEVVLLNFWATWCPPCIREMPSLDRLQAALGGEGLRVVAISEDFAGMEVVGPFLERLGLANLEVYLDTKGRLMRQLGVVGLPETLLIDRDGNLVGGLQGPAEWDSEEAVSLIRHYLAHRESAQAQP